MPVPYQFRRAVEAVIKPLLQIAKMSDYIAWTDWTPTVTQNAVSVSCAVTEAKYCVIGKVCHIYARLVITGTGSASGDAAIVVGGVPAAAHPATYDAHFAVGSAVILDSDTASNGCQVIAVTASTFKFVGYNVGNYVGLVPNFALANNDKVMFTATYRVA